MNEIKAWVARDEEGMLYLYLREPQKVTGQWTAPDLHLAYIKLGDTTFPRSEMVGRRADDSKNHN